MNEMFALGFEDTLHEGLASLVSSDVFNGYDLVMQVGVHAVPHD